MPDILQKPTNWSLGSRQTKPDERSVKIVQSLLVRVSRLCLSEPRILFARNCYKKSIDFVIDVKGSGDVYIKFLFSFVNLLDQLGNIRQYP